MKMHLSTHEEVDLADFGHEHLVVLCENLESFRSIHDAMLEDGAMEEIEVEEDGQTIAVIRNARISGAQTVANLDGTVTGHFYLADGTYDLDGGEYAQAGRILLGEEE